MNCNKADICVTLLQPCCIDAAACIGALLRLRAAKQKAGDDVAHPLNLETQGADCFGPCIHQPWSLLARIVL